MSIGWGLIGPGGWGDNQYMPAINQSAGGELIAVCHYRKEKAEFYASRNGAKRSYTSIEEMVRDSEIDAVLLATPDNLHRDEAVTAAQAGKHVFCALPLALNAGQCKEMIEACQKAGVKLATGYQWCYHPSAVEMRRLISSGEIGEVTLIEGHMSLPFDGRPSAQQVYWKIPPRPNVQHNPRLWTLDSNILHDVCHLGIVINQLRCMLGRDVDEVAAFSNVVPEGMGRDRKELTLLRFEGDIYGVAYSGSANPFDDDDVTVYGTEGRLREIGTFGLDSAGKDLEIFKTPFRRVTMDVRERRSETYANLYFEGERFLNRVEYSGTNMNVDEIDAFHKCIEEDTEPLCSGIAGLREREAIAAVMESVDTGKAVKVQRAEIRGKRIRK